MNQSLLDSFKRTRKFTSDMTEFFSREEMTVQPEEWVSPIKWHLGHTTWFFDQIILTALDPSYSVDDDINHAFNSYYEAFGERVPRGKRSLIMKPAFDGVLEYRHTIEEKMCDALTAGVSADIGELVLLGIHHEKQHQELMLQDLKSIRSLQRNAEQIKTSYVFENNSTDNEHFRIQEGLYEIGANAYFSYDNESPQHKVYLYDAHVDRALVTNSDYLEFMESGGYQNFAHWLSDGFSWVRLNKINAPLYWRKNQNGNWEEFCLWKGWHPLNLKRPVSHVNYYEASAFAKWKQARLPLESELELLFNKLQSSDIDSCEMPVFSKIKHARDPLWQWTSSDFASYPRYKPANDATMEYNSKFMCSQKVLRGGSYATPLDHLRASYRNFYYPHERWMYSGVRLAYDN